MRAVLMLQVGTVMLSVCMRTTALVTCIHSNLYRHNSVSYNNTTTAFYEALSHLTKFARLSVTITSCDLSAAHIFTAYKRSYQLFKFLNFPKPLIKFHDFLGLEFDIINSKTFHNFP